MKEGAKLRGHFKIRVFERKGGKLLSETECYNVICNEGLDRILDVMLHATTQTATWYCALMADDYSILGTENYDAPGYTEFINYSGERPAYVENASSGQSIDNVGNEASYTITGAGGTLYGASLVSVITKGDHTPGANNVLFCLGKFTTPQPVIAANVVELTYTVTAADDAA